MDVQLQVLIDKIKQDGIASAKAEADKIISDSEKKAESIIAEAQNKAAEIIKNANYLSKYNKIPMLKTIKRLKKIDNWKF